MKIMNLMKLVIMLTLCSTAFSQKPHDTAATYENKIKFLNTEIDFNNFKANNESV